MHVQLNKLKIKQVKPIAENTEIDTNNWIISDGKIVCYEIESKKITEDVVDDASEEEKKLAAEMKRQKEEAWLSFVQKYQIRCGYHKVDADEGMLAIPASKEVFFDTKTSLYLKKLFSNFFAKASLLKDKFKKNKRAYLLYSDPGMGKSALIRNFCEHALLEDGTAVLLVDGDVSFNLLNHIFLKAYAEDVKRIILVIEDFGKKDASTTGVLYNPSCLNFLDGTAGLFRVPTMILCTTNYVKELGAHLTNRPGRFNKLIQVLPPTDDEIFALVEGVGGIMLTDEQKDAFRGKGMTPDHVIEAIIRHELEEISLEASANEVLKERQGII